MKQSTTLPRGAETELRPQDQERWRPHQGAEGPGTGLKHMPVKGKTPPALEFVSWSCWWCASSRGRRRMRNARAGPRGPGTPENQLPPLSRLLRGGSTLHLATLVPPVQLSLPILLKISVLPPAFLLCGLSCKSRWPQADIVCTAARKEAESERATKERASAPAPSPCFLPHHLISRAGSRP